MKHTLSLIVLLVLVVIGINVLSNNSEQTETPKHQNTSSETNNDDWKIIENTEMNYSFSYPESLETTYISTVDWPPQVQITDQDFACTEAGEVIDRAGKTEEKTINGTTYCVTEITEGAAGSIYHQYAYGFEGDDSTVYMTASLRFVQCANHDELQQSECQDEQENFDMDILMGEIAQTLVVEK